MSGQDESNWRFPQNGTNFSLLKDELARARSVNINYAKDTVLGFPGTTPLPEVVKAIGMFVQCHPNNIGVHTADINAERGFGGTQRIEREAIYMVANLIGVEDPEAEIDGYICSGGTGGNDHGMWLGRNILLESDVPSDTRQGIVVLKSPLGHYSIDKNFGRLFGTPIPRSDRDAYQRYASVLDMPEMNDQGELSPATVIPVVRDYYDSGFRRFLLVLTAGTINLGSIDQIEAINDALAALKQDLEDLHVYIHVDAAFGGFVIPFLEGPPVKFGFQNSLVGSVSLDAHKMLYTTYPAGIFLCRKGALEFTTTVAKYLESGFDRTVNGSRPGTAPVGIWTAIRVLGRSGYEAKVRDCMRATDHLRRRLSELGEDVFLYPSQLNVQAAWLSPAVIKALDAVQANLPKKLCLPTEEFPNFTKSAAVWHNAGSCTVYRFLVTPTLRVPQINKFVNRLKAELNGARKAIRQSDLVLGPA